MKSIVLALLAVNLLAAAPGAACAPGGELFHGYDAYTIDRRPVMRVNYDGTQTLRIEPQGSNLRLENTIRYTKSIGPHSSVKIAHVVRIITSDYQDVQTALNQDEDSLSLLDQPFAEMIDHKTLGALAAPQTSIPFTATSPLGGEALHGTLRTFDSTTTSPTRGVHVAFQASGPMSGPLPELPAASINGRISLVGTAFYDPLGTLLRLESRLRIAGTLTASGQRGPIRIVFVRTFTPACLSKVPLAP